MLSAEHPLRLTSIKVSHTTCGYPCFFCEKLPDRQLLPVLLVVANALVTQQAVNQVLSRVRRSSCKQGGESGEKRNQGTINWTGESDMFNSQKYHRVNLLWTKMAELMENPPSFLVNQIQNDCHFSMAMVVYLSLKGDHRIIPQKMEGIIKGWKSITTVDGKNPAPVDMVNINISDYLQGFWIHPRWLALGCLKHQQYP